MSLYMYAIDPMFLLTGKGVPGNSRESAQTRPGTVYMLADLDGTTLSHAHNGYDQPMTQTYRVNQIYI